MADIAAAHARGRISTTATTEVAIRATAYTEQASNAQRSLASSSAADAPAGTGARIVRVTYYSLAAGVVAGPFSEDVALNGTTPVNMASPAVCLIESLEIITAGAGGMNAGIVTLFSAVAGGGVPVASIAAADRRTLYAHHYVPSGVHCAVTGLWLASSAVAASPPNVVARSLDYSTPNAAERIIAAAVTQGLGGARQITFSQPRLVVGPARIAWYVTPLAITAAVHQLSFEFTDNR